MSCWILLLGSLFIIVASRVKVTLASDTFSSVAELENLYEKEQLVGRRLQDLLNDVVHPSEDNPIKEYLEELKEIHSAGLDSKGIISNPINAFHLMRRLTILWDQVKSSLTSHSIDILKEVENFSKDFPTMDDLSGAAFSLAQLQGAYGLNVSQLARGYIHVPNQDLSFSSIRGLNARDCLFIGKHAFNKGLYDQAVQWISTALELAHAEGNRTARVDEIGPFLATAIRVHDDVLEKKGPLGREWRTSDQPYNQLKRRRLLAKPSHKQSSADNDRQHRLATNRSTDWEEMEVFYQLCRGERLRPASVEKDLKCRLVSHTHPYFILRQLKLEEHSLSPYIVAVHDFLSEAEAQLFKSLVIGRLKRSAHAGKRDMVTSDKRTSKQSWVKDEEHVAVDAVSRRISSFVGLNDRPTDIGSEMYQVANYGMGGRYTPHTDHGVLAMPDAENSDYDKFRGDRIATFMAYLDDVEAGGATVFTHVGVTVWPKKGSAVFWWNLLSDLNGDLETRHGGCPVLVGSKWICNKWFHSGEQILKRPCGLQRSTRIAFPCKIEFKFSPSLVCRITSS